MAEGKDQPTAIAICYASITGAAEKANYGARAGQVIAGNLGRGGGGRFARAGSGGAAAQPSKPAMSVDMAQQLGLPTGTLEILNGMRAGNPVTAAQAEALVAAGLAKAVDGGIVMTRAARTVIAASKRGDVDAARAAIAAAKPKPKPGKGGGKAPKPTAEERAQARAAEQEKKFLKVALDAADIDDEDLARDFLEFARGRDFSVGANAQVLEKMGLVETDADGRYRLSSQGRSFVNAALRGDTRRARDAMSKIADRRVSAVTEADVEKSLKDRIWDAITGLFRPEDTTGLSASFKVYKQADGAFRWVAISSNSYLDRDGEIVSQKALEDDVARADATGEYGDLLWWHEPGLALGVCDYNAMAGRMLVESGTFKSAKIGAAFEQAQARLGTSIGFRHPRSEPGPDGVFKNIRRFERSPLPLGFASNPYTAFSVTKGKIMDQKKRDALAELIGQEAANEVITAAQTQQKQNDDAGVRTKEAEAAAAPAETTATTSAAALVKVVAEPDPYVGDMKVGELTAALEGALTKAVGHILETFKAQQAETAKAAGEQAQELATTKAALTEAEAKVKQYEALLGDLPRAQQRAYRPIGDGKAEVSEQKAKELAPAADNAPRSWLYNFVSGQPENGAGAN